MRTVTTCGLAAVLISGSAACLEPQDAPEVGTSEASLTREVELLSGEHGWWQVSAIGGDRGTAWRQPGYAYWQDSGWYGQSAPFGYGETYLDDVIEFGPDAAHKPPTVYALQFFNVEEPADIRSLRLDLMYDDGAVVYINGTEVARPSMPAGPVTYQTFALGHEANNQYVSIDITAHSGLLIDGLNTMAVEIHQADAGSSDLVFSAGLVAQVQDPPPPPAGGGYVPARSEWSFWDAGGDLGTAWRQPGYDASLWRRGAGPLGYGEDYLGTQVGYGPSASNKYITTYFRRDFIVDDPAAVRTITAGLMYDDGVVVYLNGTRIMTAAMPAGTTTPSTPALGHEASGTTYDPFDWTAHRGLLRAGLNTLAVEVHQQNASSSDLVFDLLMSFQLGSATPPPTGGASVARRSTWSYFAGGGDLGTAWRAPGFADGGWATGAGPLGYGESYLGTTVGYGPNAANKYPTTYFRKHFNLALAGATVTALRAEVMYDDGAVVYLNGQEVTRLSMPAGTVTASTRALGHEANNAYQTIDLGGFANLLVNGDNVIAVEVHQLDAGSSDLVMDLALTVETSGGGSPVTTPVFQRYGSSPVVAHGDFEDDDSHWYADLVESPEVVRIAADQWVMYFTGNDGVGPHYMIGRALSSDGVTWTVDQEWTGGTRVEGVLYDGTTYRMYTSEYWEDGIYVSTSTDGVNWTGGGMALPFDTVGLAVIQDGSRFKMWMTYADRVLYVTSADGIHWAAQGYVAGLIGGGGAHVVKDGGVYKMWISEAAGMRYATSPDGINWTRHGVSLPPAGPGTWDGLGMSDPCVMRDGASWRMWYDGTDDTSYITQIGYATSP